MGMKSPGGTSPVEERHRMSASAPIHRPSAREMVGRYSRKNSPWARPFRIAARSITGSPNEGPQNSHLLNSQECLQMQDSALPEMGKRECEFFPLPHLTPSA